MPGKKNYKSRQINLVPEEGLSSTTTGRVLLWILSTFRILLIVTEVVVIGAFISRFWLDAKNTDLTEEMKTDKEIISSMSEFEEDFKSVQRKLDLYNSYTVNKGVLDSNLKTIISYKPAGIYFKSVNVGIDKISLMGMSVSEIELQQYMVNLKASNKFENVKLGSISLSKENSSIDFTLETAIKKEI